MNNRTPEPIGFITHTCGPQTEQVPVYGLLLLPDIGRPAPVPYGVTAQVAYRTIETDGVTYIRTMPWRSEYPKTGSEGEISSQQFRDLVLFADEIKRLMSLARWYVAQHEIESYGDVGRLAA